MFTRSICSISKMNCCQDNSFWWIIIRYTYNFVNLKKKSLSQLYFSLTWHHNCVWLAGFYPPYCHCCTWPPGTADGTCGHTCQVCPPALAWCLCAAGRLHIPMTWPAFPCRWCNPGTANQKTSAATGCAFMILSHFTHSNCPDGYISVLCVFLLLHLALLLSSLCIFSRHPQGFFLTCDKNNRWPSETCVHPINNK